MDCFDHILAQLSNADELYDIVILEPKTSLWPFFIWALLIFVLLGSIAALIINILRSRSPNAPVMSPQDRARARFRVIQQKTDSIPVSEIMLEVSDTLKDYLAEKYDDPLRFETTQEFLKRISKQKTKLPAAVQLELRSFLVAADEIKFGRSADAEEKSLPLIKAAENVVSLCQTIDH